MQNTRYVLRNHAALLGASLKTPLPGSDPNFPEANMLDPDRSILWALGPTGGDVNVFLDITSSKTTDIVGLLGWQAGGTVALPSNVIFRAGSVYPEDGSWVAIGATGIGFTSRDIWFELGSPVTYRYWKITLGFNFNGFMMAKPLIGQMASLGLGYSPGSAEDLVVPQMEEPGAWGRSSVVSKMGTATSDPSLIFRNVTDATRAILRGLAVTGDPFLLMHPILGLMEVRCTGGRQQYAHQWGAAAANSNLWDIQANFTQIP